MEIEMCSLSSICGICMKNMDTSQTVIIDCEHKFHALCLISLKEQKCPLCKEEFPDEYYAYCAIIFRAKKATKKLNQFHVCSFSCKKQKATFLSFTLGDILGILEDMKKHCPRLMGMYSIIKLRDRLLLGLISMKEEALKVKKIQPVYESYMERYDRLTCGGMSRSSSCSVLPISM
jgi:Ring finger domain